MARNTSFDGQINTVRGLATDMAGYEMVRFETEEVGSLIMVRRELCGGGLRRHQMFQVGQKGALTTIFDNIHSAGEARLQGRIAADLAAKTKR